MIVSLNELKDVLGIELTDVSQDAYLTRLIKAKTAWIEGYTQQRFDTPIPHSQIEPGSGEPELYLEWKVDDTIYEPPLLPSPTTSVDVFRRPINERYRPWEQLTEGQDWERRGQILYMFQSWSIWPMQDEFKIEYLGGYGLAPEDIKEVLLEMCADQYKADQTTASGTSGITSEKIGDYNYAVDLGNVTTSNTDTGTSAMGIQTLNRYKRRFV